MEADLANAPINPKPDKPPSNPRRRTLSATERDYELRKREWDTHGADLYYDWVDEKGVKAFEKALSDEPNDSPDFAPPEKIRAVSDFAPIKERVRKGPKRRRDIVREGWAYHVSRWPLLAIIFTVIFLEFLGYLLVRQLVNVIEYFSAWRGHRGKLRLALRNAQTYDEWKKHALALDDYLHYSDWKHSAPNAYYDSPLVRRVVKALRELRAKDDVDGLCTVLHAVLRSNFAGVESFRLYSETFYGTKELVQDFVDEVARSIEYVRQADETHISLEEKADFFRSAAKNLGATALCLSGGASFGYYHFGQIRALLDEGLLPRVMSGTSAGAIVAAFACTRTDDELKELLVPELANRINACRDSTLTWMMRAWRTGARFDAVQWARDASFFCLGSMTFKEAFERTGRILNISVIPYDTHSPTKLLNYITAPDCIIYTACIASAAVPGILNPVVLLTKQRDGTIAPWEFGGKHKDGSLRVDIPLHSLHLLYNVNFSIVSQVNPHIHLFNFAPRGAPGRPVSHRRGKGWRGGFLLSAAEQFLKIELMKNFRVIRDLELLPELGGQNWSAVFLQKFEGTVTIWPKSRLWDWFRILTDPDPHELARMIRVGQNVTWPKIKMIENRLKIERQIDLGRDQIARQYSRGGEGSGTEPHLPHRTSSFDMLHPQSSKKADKSDEDGSGRARSRGRQTPDVHPHELSSSSSSSESESGSDSDSDSDTEGPSSTQKSASASGKNTTNGHRKNHELEERDLDGASSPSLVPPPTNASDGHSNGHGPRSPSMALSPEEQAKRRKAILARFGLRNAAAHAGPSPGDRDGGDSAGGGEGLSSEGGRGIGLDGPTFMSDDEEEEDDRDDDGAVFGDDGERTRRRSVATSHGAGNSSGARRRFGRTAAATALLTEFEQTQGDYDAAYGSSSAMRSADLTSSDDEVVRRRRRPGIKKKSNKAGR